MIVPGLPVFGPGDAEVYGWRFQPMRKATCGCG